MADDLNEKLDKARAIEAELRTKFEGTKAESEAIEPERKKLAYAANTGNDAAGLALGKLNKRKAEVTAELDSLQVALSEAARRVAEAERAVTVQAERGRALAAIGLLTEFRSDGHAIDEALCLAVEKYQRLRAILFELQKLGFGNPTVAQLAALGRRAMMTALMGSDLQIEHLAPGERRSMSELIDGWAEHIEKLARYRAGKGDDKEAA